MWTPTGERWAELRSAFDALTALDPSARSERLAAIAASDPEARRALDELLAADAEADDRLARMDRLFTSCASSHPPDQGSDPLGLVGRTVSHFRILEPLGTGGMGVVYRAEDTNLARPVALKFPLSERRLHRSDRDRFLREARTAAALDHPNLCGIYEAGETDEGHLFIAMALYQGETLKDRIARDGPLPISESIGIATQIARGLAAIHAAGIVHRDMKAANVMLLPDGSVRILDFGLAKVVDVALTASRATLGTIAYMAPEQVRGQPIDGRTDLWALGVLLFEMLTGRRPFEGEHEIAIAHEIVYSEPTRLRTLRPETGAGLERLVHRLLSKPPGARPTADRVLEELAAVELDPSKQRRLPDLPAFAGRRRPLVAAAAVLVLVGLIVGVPVALQRGSAPPTLAGPILVAVLPFESASDSEEDELLALGLTEVVATQLLRLRSLAVPIVLTAAAYHGSRRSWAEISGSFAGKGWDEVARELEVDVIVRGGFQRSGDSVRVDLELFAADGRRVPSAPIAWFGATELVQLQRETSRAIVAALNVDVSASEREMLDHLPTTNPQAYQLYLQGRGIEVSDAFRHGSLATTESWQGAHSLYARARELDPNFAIARARVAYTALGLVAYGGDRTRARSDQARLEAEAALRIHPGLPEAHEALGYYWSFERDQPKAVAELGNALAGFPNMGDLYAGLAMSLRSLGRWDEAVRAFESAIRFDPRHRGAHREVALTHSRLRRYEDAIRHWDRVIALDDTDPTPHLLRGHAYQRLEGTVDSLEAALARIPAGWDASGMTTWSRFTVLRNQRRLIEALAVLDSAVHPISRDGLVFRPVTLMRAATLEELGQHAPARANYESARALLEDSVAAYPQNAGMRVALGLTYAGLGRRTDAMREARTAAELLSPWEGHPEATAAIGGAVEILARLGETEPALQLLEVLLAVPAGREVSVPLLRTDPIYDSLRGDPRFENMLQRYAPD
jgi:eukaryotic-like serine/threonine-protein kinase